MDGSSTDSRVCFFWHVCNLFLQCEPRTLQIYRRHSFGTGTFHCWRDHFYRDKKEQETTSYVVDQRAYRLLARPCRMRSDHRIVDGDFGSDVQRELALILLKSAFIA